MKPKIFLNKKRVKDVLPMGVIEESGDQVSIRIVLNADGKLPKKLKKFRNVIKVKTLIILVCFASLAIGSGCGDNPVNNSNNNPPPVNEDDSLIWQRDSLSIYGIGWQTTDLAIFNLLNTPDSLKLIFTLQGNLIIPDSMYVAGHGTGPNSINFGIIDISLLNRDFIFRGRTGLPFSMIFNLNFYSLNFRYLKLKDIKLFKVIG